MWRTTVVAAARALALVTASAAQAAPQWYDGEVAISELQSCLTFEPLFGAGAYVGQYADEANLPRPGEVFYGHIVFSGLTESCGEQHAEVDLVLPPGVSIAPDAGHPIKCFYSDDGGETEHEGPSCPSHAVTGTYGPMLPPQDGGAAWSLPEGRILEVEVPLVSSRALDVTGGTCQRTTAELVSSGSDCLVGAVHVIDGQSNPWLVPSKQLFVAPPPPPAPAPPAGGGRKPQPPLGAGVAGRGTAAVAALARVKHGRAMLRLTCRGAGACRGLLRLVAASRRKRAAVIGRSKFAIPAGRSRRVAVKLNRRGRAILRHARRHRLRVKAVGTDLSSRRLLLVGRG